MKRIMLLTIFILTACAGGHRYSWETQRVDRQDGIYGDWTTSNHSNEFSNWTSSRVLGSEGGLFSNQSYIEVQSSQQANIYVGINIGDAYICGDYIRTKMAWAWDYSDGQAIIEETRLNVSENNESLKFSDSFEWEREKNRFIHMLNIFDKLTIQSEDTCGEVTIVRFDIEGTHHLTTTETRSDGMTSVVRSESNVSDHIKYHKKGVFGFGFQNLTDDARRLLDRDTGIEVISVAKGSPVDNAGLLVGDYVIFVDNNPLNNVTESSKVFDEGDYRGRSRSTLTIIRDGQTKEIEVDLQGLE
ncbi:MAG: PDZ domain-containing protein [Flavobacteriales bacterium]|jgi:hypothetical protein|nr:PDZ domain-containing protein [Flavobacteriales bacterium]